MHRAAKSIVRLATVLMACGAVATAGCLKISEPGSKGLSIVTEPDTTPIVIAPLSITMVAGPSATPAGLAYTLTVRNTADTVAGVNGAVCGGLMLSTGVNGTGARVNLAFPPCPPVIAIQPLQPGQSTSFTRLLANQYIPNGTATGDYFVTVQLPVPGDSKTGNLGSPTTAGAGQVHWGG